MKTNTTATCQRCGAVYRSAPFATAQSQLAQHLLLVHAHERSDSHLADGTGSETLGREAQALMPRYKKSPARQEREINDLGDQIVKLSTTLNQGEDD